MLWILKLLFTSVVRDGDLTLVGADGVPHRFGNGSGPPVTATINDRRLEWHLALDPELAFGEGFSSGRLSLKQGSVYDLVALLMRNAAAQPLPPYAQRFAAIRNWLRPLAQFNPARRARRNVTHHYDIDPRIYDLFLDPDRQYSCAYFATPRMSLADARRRPRSGTSQPSLRSSPDRACSISDAVGAASRSTFRGRRTSDVTRHHRFRRSS